MKEFRENEISLEIFCRYFNNIISEAITHGGDTGGPYFVNEEGLKEAINNFLIWSSLKEVVTLYDCSHYPQLIIKRRIETDIEENKEKK